MTDKSKIELIRNSLLNKFILERYRNYVEPQRKGTPKGQTIGLSREKYWASLQMLFAFKQKDMAKLLGVSYGVLRLWNMEEGFKKTILANCYDFAEYVVAYLRKKVDEDLKAQDKLLQQPISKMVKNTSLSQWNFEEFIDSKFYSPILMNILMVTFDKVVEETDDINFRACISATISAFEYFSGIPKSPELKEKEKELKNKLERSLICDVRDILLKEKISLSDKKRAVWILNHLEKWKS